MLDVITYALLRKRIASAASGADWEQTNELAPDYIKNKPVEETEDDAMEMLAEMGLADSVTDEENNILTDENGNVLTIE